MPNGSTAKAWKAATRDSPEEVRNSSMTRNPSSVTVEFAKKSSRSDPTRNLSKKSCWRTNKGSSRQRPKENGSCSISSPRNLGGGSAVEGGSKSLNHLGG